MTQKIHPLIIIGSGPAGLTAALYAARADLEPLVLEGDNPGGQLMQTMEIENFPGFSEPTTGPELIMKMKEHAQMFGAKFENGFIKEVDFSDPKKLVLKTNDTEYLAQSIIIATGAKARWLNLGKEEEERFWGKGYSACATCDGAFFRNKTVAVVGGGDTACEEADFLTKFAEKVYIIHRRKELRASKPLIKRVLDNPKVEIIWNQNVTDLHGENLLKSVELTETDTGETSTLELNGLFAAIGHDPATGFLEGILPTEHGYLSPTNKTQTPIESVFVAGDVTDFRYRQAIVASGAGCMAALDVEQYLSSLKD